MLKWPVCSDIYESCVHCNISVQPCDIKGWLTGSGIRLFCSAGDHRIFHKSETGVVARGGGGGVRVRWDPVHLRRQSQCDVWLCQKPGAQLGQLCNQCWAIGSV